MSQVKTELIITSTQLKQTETERDSVKSQSVQDQENRQNSDEVGPVLLRTFIYIIELIL